MATRSMVSRVIGAGILSAAICLPAFSTTRTVPSWAYPNIQAAYDACSNGDVISVTSNQSTAGFQIAKSITIQNGSANPTVSITLSSGFTIAADNVTFTGLKIYGKNSSTARCIQVNAGADYFIMNDCFITKASGGTTGYGVYDLGSNYSTYYGCTFTGTTVGLLAINTNHFQTHLTGSFNNPYRNIRTVRNSGDISWWLEGISFYAGSSSGATCFSAYNNDSNHIPWYWIEGCSFRAYGTGAKCTTSETSSSMNDINLQACSLIHCP